MYVLRCQRDGYLYVGFTNNLQRRLSEYRSGMVSNTAKRGKIELEAYFAVKNKVAAVDLEKYFKKGSGKSFLYKRILSSEVTGR